MARHVGAGSGPVGRGTFALGVLTTGLVTLAWTTNHFAKPLATLFGGAVTCGGLLLGLATDTLAPCRGRPRVFPLLHHPEYPLVFLTRGRRARPLATVLAVLPRQAAQVGALVRAAHAVAAGGAVVFVQRGTHDPTTRPPRLFEIVDPHLDDPAAQEAFTQAECLAHHTGRAHRYLYLPSTAGPEALARFWQTLRPAETLVVAGEEDILSAIPAAAVYVHRSAEDGVPILHYVAHTKDTKDKE